MSFSRTCVRIYPIPALPTRYLARLYISKVAKARNQVLKEVVLTVRVLMLNQIPIAKQIGRQILQLTALHEI